MSYMGVNLVFCQGAQWLLCYEIYMGVMCELNVNYTGITRDLHLGVTWDINGNLFFFFFGFVKIHFF